MNKRSWRIKGSDNRMYVVVERELPGIRSNPLGGPSRIFSTGNVEYVLADGNDVLDHPSGMWETEAGVLLPKPADLE